MSLEIQTIDFQNPARLAFEAGLLLSPVLFADDRSELAAQYPLKAYAQVATHYGVLEQPCHLVAATAVTHGEQSRGGTLTVVRGIAVQPYRRGEGIGRHLMLHIAEQAIAAGDAAIRLAATEYEFYRKLGFTGIPTRMIADPYDVLVAEPIIDKQHHLLTME